MSIAYRIKVLSFLLNFLLDSKCYISKMQNLSFWPWKSRLGEIHSVEKIAHLFYIAVPVLQGQQRSKLLWQHNEEVRGAHSQSTGWRFSTSPCACNTYVHSSTRRANLHADGDIEPPNTPMGMIRRAFARSHTSNKAKPKERKKTQPTVIAIPADANIWQRAHSAAQLTHSQSQDGESALVSAGRSLWCRRGCEDAFTLTLHSLARARTDCHSADWHSADWRERECRNVCD